MDNQLVDKIFSFHRMTIVLIFLLLNKSNEIIGLIFNILYSLAYNINNIECTTYFSMTPLFNIKMLFKNNLEASL